MVEKFYQVKESNPIYQEYFDWFNGLENRRIKWEEFRKLTGIETKAFAPYDCLYIIPTENDLNKFANSFCKEVFNNGLRRFKANSKIHKDWVKFSKLNNMTKQKPSITFDFIRLAVRGRMTTRLFHFKNGLYCSINADMPEDLEAPEGYEEMKESAITVAGVVTTGVKKTTGGDNKQEKHRAYMKKYFQENRDTWNEYQKKKARERANELKMYRSIRKRLEELGIIINQDGTIVLDGDGLIREYIEDLEKGESVIV